MTGGLESSPGEKRGLGITLRSLASSFLPSYVYDSNKSTPRRIKHYEAF